MNTLNKIILKEFNRILNEDPFTTKQEMANKLDISTRTVARYCQKLGIFLHENDSREIKACEYLKKLGYTVIKNNMPSNVEQ